MLNARVGTPGDERPSSRVRGAAEGEPGRRSEQRVRARATADGERERYRDLFDSAPDAYVVTDGRGEILEANRAAARLLNSPHHLVIGRPLESYVVSSDRSTFRTRVAEFEASDEPHEWEFRVGLRRGAFRDVAATVATSRDAGETVLRWLLRDISVRRQAEAEVRALAATLERRVRNRTRELSVERDRLRLLFERLNQGVITVNRQLRVGFANHEIRAILGTAHLRAGDELPDVWGATSLRALARQLHERGAQPVETLIDDGQRALLVAGLPARGLGEAVLVVTDVTERERRDRAERAFVTNAAHELQTPLTAISSAVEVLQDGAKTDPEQLDHFLGHIEREASRLRRLAHALMTLARVQTGVEPPRPEPIDVAELLDAVALGLQPAEGVMVSVDCPREIVVLANRDLAEQAVVNLAGNAAKYTKTGTIVLSASRLDGDRIAIDVVDTGRGIPPA